jgi:DNA-binding ferritin-like protein
MPQVDIDPKRAKHNENFSTRWVAITNQPQPKGSRHVGHATFEWVNGPKKGQKQSQIITLGAPAELSIDTQGQLLVTEKNKEPYVFGDKTEDTPSLSDIAGLMKKAIGTTTFTNIETVWQDIENAYKKQDVAEDTRSQARKDIMSVAAEIPHLQSALQKMIRYAQHIEKGGVTAAVIRAEDTDDIPLVGRLEDSITQMLADQCDDYIEGLRGEGEDPEFDTDIRSDVRMGTIPVPESLKEAATSFTKAAWTALKSAVSALPQMDADDVVDVATELFEINDVGAWYMYHGAVGSGVSGEDYWGGRIPRSELRIMCQALKADLTQAAHAFEASLYEAATVIVNDHTVAFESEEVARGPDADDIIYRYAGTNDTIAGASAAGMYVAELVVQDLKGESKELGHCLGNPKHGHPQLLEEGTTNVYSIRTEAGKSKFSIEQYVEDGDISEVKGKANRLPGYEPGASKMTKPDEVRLVVEFLMKGLNIPPAEIKYTKDIRPGVLAMEAAGQDPFSPPPKKKERPNRDPRIAQAKLSASVKWAKEDYARVIACTDECGCEPEQPSFEIAGINLVYCVKAATFIVQSAHWLAEGEQFLSLHELYGDLYEVLTKASDSVTERVIGLTGSKEWAAPSTMSQMVFETITQIRDQNVSACPHIEEVLHTINQVVLHLSQDWQGATPGFVNLVQGIADELEVFTYKIKQQMGITYDFA